MGTHLIALRDETRPKSPRITHPMCISSKDCIRVLSLSNHYVSSSTETERYRSRASAAGDAQRECVIGMFGIATIVHLLESGALNAQSDKKSAL